MSDNIGIGVPPGNWDILEDTPRQAALAFNFAHLYGPFCLVVMRKPDALQFFVDLDALSHWAAEPREWDIGAFGEWDERLEHPTWEELEQWAL